jgi:hypothetical protein
MSDAVRHKKKARRTRPFLAPIPNQASSSVYHGITAITPKRKLLYETNLFFDNSSRQPQRAFSHDWYRPALRYTARRALWSFDSAACANTDKSDKSGHALTHAIQRHV